MREIDAGHKYGLMRLDGAGEEILTFVKREGANYPGNVGHYEGTNVQEVLRACMARIRYLDGQIKDVRNTDAMEALRDALWAFEIRAAERHGRLLPIDLYAALESHPVCRTCGHVGCGGNCREQSPCFGQGPIPSGAGAENESVEKKEN